MSHVTIRPALAGVQWSSKRTRGRSGNRNHRGGRRLGSRSRRHCRDRLHSTNWLRRRPRVVGRHSPLRQEPRPVPSRSTRRIDVSSSPGVAAIRKSGQARPQQEAAAHQTAGPGRTRAQPVLPTLNRHQRPVSFNSEFSVHGEVATPTRRISSRRVVRTPPA